MKVLILEDEVPAQMQLKRLLKTYFPQYEVVAALDAVESAVNWLEDNQPDLILMDVELADGICFELFSRIEVKAPVIVITAYEHYALNALKNSAVDYLLKPIDDTEFVHAIEKCRTVRHQSIDIKSLEKGLASSHVYKQRFVIKVGDQIIMIPVSDIAYFFSREKSTYIMTKDGRRFLSDQSLETTEELVNPKDFFMVSRNCLAAISSISSISKHFNSRLRLQLKPDHKELILVSRARVPAFMAWIEGELQ
jgi:DNA-binding LytR/AlgR family response regulator